jgi:hypothetical protein
MDGASEYARGMRYFLGDGVVTDDLVAATWYAPRVGAHVFLRRWRRS